MILAGEPATRMGGQDKGLLTLNGVTLVEQVIAGLRPQVEGFKHENYPKIIAQSALPKSKAQV